MRLAESSRLAGIYGAARETSPELGRLAEDAIVFETAVASAPWTIPSHATLLTSTYPLIHGADGDTPIAGSVVLVSETLHRAGWQTAGFVDTSYLDASRGFDRGFEHYDDEPPEGSFRRGAQVVLERFLEWLERADERPAFVFWHIMDVHGPYDAPPPFAGRFRSGLAPGRGRPLDKLQRFAYHDYLRLDRFASFEDLVAGYDEGILAVDAVIGELFQNLRRAGLYDDGLIVVTSDHGESFWDHGIWVGHGLFLTDDELRVPLLVKLPGNRHAGTRVADMVGLIDVAPTMLEALGVPPESPFQGRSLFSPAPRTVFGFSSNIGAAFVRTRDFKYIAPAGLERRPAP